MSFEKELNNIICSYWTKYVLCLLFFKKIFMISQLLVCWIFVALFYYFVWTSSSSQIKDWFHSSFHFKVFFSGLNLGCIEFIAHYGRCILVSYYHSCQVKFKSIQNIVFQEISLKHIHTFTHRFAKQSDEVFFKFSWLI